MIAVYALVFVGALNLGLWFFRRYRIRSTPTDLVIERKHPHHVVMNQAAKVADWATVRDMEWELYGHYLTGLDGRPLDEDDPAAHVKEPAKAAHSCKHCGRPATWRSKVDAAWLCGACHPCWCNYCQGRVGVHGADAEALYKAQAEAAFRQKTPRTVISAGRNVVITGNASGVIVTGDDVAVHQGQADDTDWAELGRNMDRLGYDLSRAIDRATRGFLG